MSKKVDLFERQTGRDLVCLFIYLKSGGEERDSCSNSFHTCCEQLTLTQAETTSRSYFDIHEKPHREPRVVSKSDSHKVIPLLPQ